MAGNWRAWRRNAPGVGIAVLCAMGASFDVGNAGAAEPVVVINAPTISGVPAEAQPAVDAIGQPIVAPPIVVAASPAASADPNFEPLSDVAAPPAAATRAGAVAVVTEPAPAVEPPASSMVALPVAAKPEPSWEKRPEFFTRPGLATITRYNRKATRTAGDADAPIVAAASKAAADPRFNVIECVAGCKGPKGTVVYYALRLSSQTGQPIDTAGIKPALATSPPPSDPAIIACVAGCYSTPKAYIARFPVAKAQAGQAGLVPVSAPTTALVPTIASVETPSPVPVRALIRRVSKRYAVQRSRKPRAWHTAVLARPAYRLPYNTWRANVRY